MNVAMMQPSFIPWQGYFELINMADFFIFLDDFQFSVQSWHQRNRLFVNKGQIGWYTVPVVKSLSFGAPLNKVIINTSLPWKNNMLKRMQQNYSKTGYFDQIFPLISKWLDKTHTSLSEQNIEFIKLVCDLLDIKTKFGFSSQYDMRSKKSEGVLELLKASNAKKYYCANGSFDYMFDEKVFPVDNVETLFQDYLPEEYEQAGQKADFVPYLSILDALFNIGPERTMSLIKNGTKKWLSWDDMRDLNQAKNIRREI